MDLQQQFENVDVVTKRSPSPEIHADNWMKGWHVQNIMRKFPHVAESLQRVLRAVIMQDALRHALHMSHEELERNLLADLREGFAGLEGGTPRTVAELDARETLGEVALTHRTLEEIEQENVEQRTGGASDYFAQRLTTVSSLVDIAKMMPLSQEMRATLQSETDRLARLLVAFNRAEQRSDEHDDSEAIA